MGEKTNEQMAERVDGLAATRFANDIHRETFLLLESVAAALRTNTALAAENVALKGALEELKSLMAYPDERIWINENGLWEASISYPSDEPGEWREALVYAALATPATDAEIARLTEEKP